MDECLDRVRAIVSAERSKRVRPDRPGRIRPGANRPRHLGAVEQLPGIAPRRGSRGARASQRRLRLGVRAPLLPLPLLVDRRRHPMPLRGRSRPPRRRVPATSDPLIVTSGDRPASRKGSSDATAWPSRCDASPPAGRRGRCPRSSRNPHRTAAVPSRATRPRPLPAGDQRLRAFRAVTEEVALAVSRKAGGEGVGIWRHPIDRRIGEPGQRHLARIDRLAGAVPFRRRSPRPALVSEQAAASGPASEAAFRRARSPTRRRSATARASFQNRFTGARGPACPIAFGAAWREQRVDQRRG